MKTNLAETKRERRFEMPLDYECLNLDIIGTEPLQKDNLEHWQQASALTRLGFERWKESGCKRVQIDGVVYELKELYAKQSNR